MAGNEGLDDSTQTVIHGLQPELEEIRPLMESPDEECRIIHENDDPDLDENFIKELYDNELELALSEEYPMIVVEPKVLGDQISRWIQVGNFIHKSSVICSLGCLVSPFILPPNNRTIVSMALGGTSLLLTAVYDISWQFDPCCKYQVEYDSHNLVKVPLEELTSPSPVVLVYKDDHYRKILHNVASLAVSAYIGYKAYQYWQSST